MEKIKVCLDVDGVLLNFFQTISYFIESEYKLKSNIPYSTSQYCLYERFNQKDVDTIEFKNMTLAFEKAGLWSSLEPMPDINLIQDLLKNPLFDITFLTSLPVHLHEQRFKNLSTILGATISEKQVICVPLGKSKKPYLEKIKPDFFIEDNLHNIRDCHDTHTSYWVNLNDTDVFYWGHLNKKNYDKSGLEQIKTVEVNHLNHAIKEIKKTLILNDSSTLMKKIESVLDDSLLTPQYKNMTRHSKTEGHCYAAAEALYHMLGGKENGLTPQVAKFVENGVTMTHWWLKDKNGVILDPTADQFYAVNSNPPYDLAKGAGFLTKHPSKRAKSIISRVVNGWDNEPILTESKSTAKIK